MRPPSRSRSLPLRLLAFALMLAPPTTAAAVTVELKLNVCIDCNEETRIDTIVIETVDDKPETTGQFLEFVTGGHYDGTILHRAITDFVLQGGGYYPIPTTEQVGEDLVPVLRYTRPDLDGNPGTPNPLIPNEFDKGSLRSNVAGTVAMAKGATPDSASHEFFFNLADNSANLDSQNGGFTVFAEVVSGMALVLQIGNVQPLYDLNPDDATWDCVTIPNECFITSPDPDGERDPGAFGDVPVVISGGINLIEIESATVVPEPDVGLAQLAALGSVVGLARFRRSRSA